MQKQIVDINKNIVDKIGTMYQFNQDDFMLFFKKESKLIFDQYAKNV